MTQRRRRTLALPGPAAPLAFAAARATAPALNLSSSRHYDTDELGDFQADDHEGANQQGDTMPKRMGLLATGVVTAFALTAAGANAADETPVGEPVERHGIEVGAAYLEAIEMDPAPAIPMSEDVIHLECDVAATSDNVHGFAEGAWVPYLTCAYKIEKVGSDWGNVGVMLPMTAQDGPHYANNVPMDGPGEYRVTYYVSPPSLQGFYRHADDATGVEPWWEPFEVSWTFEFGAE